MTEQLQGAMAARTEKGSVAADGVIRSEVVTIKDVYYSIPRKTRLAMWRFKLSNGLTVWMRMDYSLVPSIGTSLRCDWLSETRISLDWPVGDGGIQPTTFDIGRFCI